MKQSQNWPILRNLIYSLILFGEVKTTKSRAKAISGLVDKLVNKSKKGTVSNIREILKTIPQKEAVEKLAKDVIPNLGSRGSGYTRILKLGRRQGDGAEMVLMTWVKDEAKVEPSLAKASEGKQVEKVEKEKPITKKVKK